MNTKCKAERKVCANIERKIRQVSGRIKINHSKNIYFLKKMRNIVNQKLCSKFSKILFLAKCPIDKLFDVFVRNVFF